MSEIQVHGIQSSKMKRDIRTVTVDGQSLQQLPHGVSFHGVTTQVDERGALYELFNPAWGWSDAPLVYAYTTSIRPGVIKGWGMHKEHEDRYFIMSGEMEVVLYDARPDSPTLGLVSQIAMSEANRGLINIPAGIWHADRNLGSKDVVFINFPTVAFNHDDPDKYRLPLDTDQIPHKFKNPNGW